MTDQVCGLVLAAGSGSRYGMPKALVDEGAGPWGPRTASLIAAAGCEPVVVVIGAESARVGQVFTGHPAELVVNPAWAEGMGTSLRFGLTVLSNLPTTVTGAIVMLVDLPGVTTAAVSRLIESVPAGDRGTALAQASYRGRPGHPVFIGREHWPGVAESASGDIGAREYLRKHRPAQVEVADIACGADRDLPPPGMTGNPARPESASGDQE